MPVSVLESVRRLSFRRRIAALFLATAVGAVAVAIFAYATEPVLFLPVMVLFVVAQAAVLMMLAAKRWRQRNRPSNGGSQAAQPPVNIAKLANEVTVWGERLQHGFAETAFPELESFANDEQLPKEIRDRARDYLAGWRNGSQPQNISAESPRLKFDVVIMSNFNLPGGTTSSNFNEIQILLNAGKSVGLIHHPLFHQNTARPINSKIAEVIDGESVCLIEPRARVECDLLIMRFPPIGMRLRDDLPEVEAPRKILIVNQSPMTFYDGVAGRKPLWDVRQVHNNIRKWAGDYQWYTAGPQVNEVMFKYHGEDMHDVDVADSYWFPTINPSSWPENDRFPGERVRIGRHSRDHLSKWPELARDLRSVYPESSRYEIKVLGGSLAPQRILGRLPDNWTTYEFDSISPLEFLQNIDVYSYYTSSACLEAFGRAPLEGIAAGVPTILSPAFEPVFQEGALYAEPHEFKETLEELIDDQPRFAAQRQRGFDVVERLFSHEAHRERLRSLGVDL